MNGRVGVNGDVPVVLTPRLMKAMNVAAGAHDGHYRKQTAIPYISHLMGVMYAASREELDAEIREDVLIACLLHDTVEDVPEKYSAGQLEKDFGPRVLELVLAVTKDESLRDWQERSEGYIAQLRQAPLEAVVVSACDKLHNLSSILADAQEIGPEIWTRFNSGKDSQKWWYESILELVKERAPQLRLIAEYEAKLEELKAL